MHPNDSSDAAAAEPSSPPPAPPPPGPPPRTFTPLSDQATRAALRAARYAALAYPGPVGELISRELRGYADAGEQLGVTAVARRLVTEMQRVERRHPLPPVRNDRGNRRAPRYVPGTPLHFRYPTAADEEPNASER